MAGYIILLYMIKIATFKSLFLCDRSLNLDVNQGCYIFLTLKLRGNLVCTLQCNSLTV